MNKTQPQRIPRGLQTTKDNFRVERAMELYQEFSSKQGLRSTQQRDLIVLEFLRSPDHVTAEELCRRVKAHFPRVGLTTVYRTLRLLQDAGLAFERRFDRNKSVFEFVAPGSHHDHLVCTACGKVVEFENDSIEALQDLEARKHGFILQAHRMELFGLCGDCKKTK